MRIVVPMPKPRSEAARMLADPRYRKRIVENKKNKEKYSRRGRMSGRKSEY